MTENPGTNPPSDDEPSTPPGPPPSAEPTPPVPQPSAEPTPPAPESTSPAPAASPSPAAPPPGAYPPPAQPVYPPPAEPAPGYGPPPGAYPPPMSGTGYGQESPQQPYGQQPYGQPTGYPQAGGATVTVGESFTWGWTKFTQNVGPILLGVLAYFAVIVAVTTITFSILIGGAAASTDAYGNFRPGGGIAFGFGWLLVVAVFVLLAAFMQAGIIRAALDVANGGRLEFASFFRFENLGNVVVAVLLVGAGTAIGSVLLIIPGIVFAFFAQFTLFFVIDKHLSPVDALKASFTIVNRNLGSVVLLYVAVLAANLVGSFLCGVGQLVSFPLGLLATAYMYRRLQNEPVAA